MCAKLAERVAQLALSSFDALPTKCKPRVHADGRQEWTPMSAIVIVLDHKTSEPALKLVSLATGTKCLPSSAIAKCNGQVLHDCHAEVLAFRGLNRWLLAEIRRLLSNADYTSPYLQYRVGSKDCDQEMFGTAVYEPFEIREAVSFYLFSTVAPCGDASMELLISSKPTDDARPWSDENLRLDLQTGVPLGRGYFSLLGAVRRKPARADAEATMSKSCTDKIAVKQVLSLLSFPTDLLIRRTESAFLKGLVTYRDQYDEAGYTRAFGELGRMQFVESLGGSHFQIHILPETCPRFTFERKVGESSRVTNLSALMVAGTDGMLDTVEVLVNGVRQGFKQFDERSGKASAVSRASMVREVFDIITLLDAKDIRGLKRDGQLFGDTYLQWKLSAVRQERTSLKKNVTAQLGGWVTNSAEDDFEIEHG